MDYRVLGNPAAEASKALRECGGAPLHDLRVSVQDFSISVGGRSFRLWPVCIALAMESSEHCKKQAETVTEAASLSPSVQLPCLGRALHASHTTECPRDEQLPLRWVQQASPLGLRGTDTSAQEGLVLGMFCLCFVSVVQHVGASPNTCVGAWTFLRPRSGQELHNLNPVSSGHSRTHFAGC